MTFVLPTTIGRVALRARRAASAEIRRALKVMAAREAPDVALARAINSIITAFCTCRRFSAWSKTMDCGPSMTSAATSSPRWAGRQCMKTASRRGGRHHLRASP